MSLYHSTKKEQHIFEHCSCVERSYGPLDVMMDQLFGELRSMVQSPNSVTHDVLAPLLLEAWENDPDQYDAQWRPYLASFDLPVVRLTSFEALEDIAKLYPASMRCSVNIPRAAEYGSVLGDERLRLALSRASSSLLTELYVHNCHLTSLGAEYIASCQGLSRLAVLNCSKNDLRDAGVRALMESSTLESLVNLSLNSTQCTSQSARVIARSSVSEGLLHLKLAYNEMGRKGAQTIAKSPHFRDLKTLFLGSCHLGDEGVEAICRSAHLTTLESLSLHNNRLGRRSGHALFDSAAQASLEMLELRNNRLDDAALRALLGGATWPSLRALDVQHNRLTGASLDTLLNWPGLPELRVLKLGHNPLGEGVLSALATFDQPLALERLMLDNALVAERELTVLSQSEVLPSLTHLSLTYNALDSCDVLLGETTLPLGLEVDLRGNPCTYGDSKLRAVIGHPHLLMYESWL